MNRRVFNPWACGTLAAGLSILKPCQALDKQPGAADAKEDAKDIAKVQRDIQKDQKKLQADQQRFGIDRPQAKRDRADLDRDQAGLAKLQGDILEDKDEAARLSSDLQQEKTLRADICSDREQLRSDLKQFDPNSSQGQAGRMQFTNDKSALDKVRADLRALRHEEKLEERTEKAPAHMPSMSIAGGHGRH